MSTERSHSIWWTPRALVEILDDEFYFDLDAAADETNAIVTPWIGPGSPYGEDGLVTPWNAQSVWCNPPYGEGLKSVIPDWVKRGYEQHLEQQNTVVMLLPAYTDPKYWRDYVTKAHEIRFLTGRLQFLDHGEKATSARFPSVLVIWKWIAGTCYKAPHIWTWDWRIQA